MNFIDIIGFIAASLTTVSFVPQVIRTIKTKSTKDISLSMFLCFNIGICFWLIYGILLHSIPIIVANICTIASAGTILGFKLKYK